MCFEKLPEGSKSRRITLRPRSYKSSHRGFCRQPQVDGTWLNARSPSLPGWLQKRHKGSQPRTLVDWGNFVCEDYTSCIKLAVDRRMKRFSSTAGRVTIRNPGGKIGSNRSLSCLQSTRCSCRCIRNIRERKCPPWQELGSSGGCQVDPLDRVTRPLNKASHFTL